MKYRCGDCNKEWSSNVERCSNCGSTRKCAPVYAEGKIGFREGILLKSRDVEGKRRPDWEYKSVSKVSGEGKEARECWCADRKGNRWVHTVEEQDENGNWVVKHRDDESLTEHNKKKS